jgi:hypothetical protein
MACLTQNVSDFWRINRPCIADDKRLHFLGPRASILYRQHTTHRMSQEDRSCHLLDLEYGTEILQVGIVGVHRWFGCCAISMAAEIESQHPTMRC